MDQKNGAIYQPVTAPAEAKKVSIPARQQAQPMNAANEIDFIEILFALLRRWKIILLCALIGAVVGGAYHMRTVRPSYRAMTEMYITNTDSVINISDLSLGSTLTADYTNIILSRATLNQVIQDLQLNTNYRGLRGLVSISNPTGTHIIRTYVTTGDLTLSRDIANDLLLVSIDRIYQVFGTSEPSVIEYSQAEAIDYVAPGITSYMQNGALVGAAIVIAIVVLITMMNTSLKTEDDVEKHLSIPVLAAVPYYKE